MSKFGIKSVSYIPLCSTEEIKLEIKKPTGNEIVKKMWDKLDDEEQGFINVMIDRDNKQNKEIERLNNIINKGIEAINVYQNEKTLSVRYQDLNRIRGILRGNEFDLKMFEEYLQELKGSDKE